MISLVPCNSPPEAMRRFEGDSEWDPQASLKSSMNPTPSTSEVVGLWLWCTCRPPYNDKRQPACFWPPFFCSTKKIAMSRLGSQPSTQPVRGLRCDNTMVFQGAEPFVWLPGISSVWMPCMLRSSIMASQSIEVCPCRMLCVFVRFPIFLVPKESVYRSCHNVKNGPKSDHHNSKIFQLFRKTGFPIWNLSWSKTGPTGRALFWSGHYWRHETIFKARAEAKTEVPWAISNRLPCHDLSLLSPASRRWLLELLEIWRPITPTTRSAFLNDRAVRRKSHMRWKIPIYPRWVIPKMNQKWEIELNYLTAPDYLNLGKTRYHGRWEKISCQVSLSKVCQIWVAPLIRSEAAIAQADGLQRAWTSA